MSNKKSKENDDIDIDIGKLLQEDDDMIGSSLDALRKIIKEVSKTKKVDAIIRAFEHRDPSDLEYLYEILLRAGLPKGDIYFIVNNWARTNNYKISDDLKVELGIFDDDNDNTSNSKDIDPSDAILKSLKLKKKIMEQELAVKTIEEQLERLNKNNNKPASYYVKKTVPKVDEKGEPMLDEQGFPVLTTIEQKVPAEQIVSGNAGTDPMVMMMMFMKMMSMNQQKEPSMLEQIAIKKLLENDSNKSIEAEKLLLQQKAESEKMINEMRQTYEKQIQELKSVMEKKELVDEFKQVLGTLNNEIEELKKKSSMDNDRFKFQTEVDLVKEGVNTVTKEVSGVRNDLKEITNVVAQEFVKDKQHKREIELAYGIQPNNSKYKRIPDVSDDEMLEEMENYEEVE